MAYTQSSLFNVKVTTDVTSYRRQVERLSKITGKSMKETMQESVSIMSGQLAKRFPPKSLAKGRKGIINDLNRIFVTDEKIAEEWEANISAGLGGSTMEARVFKTKTGAIYGVDKKFYRPNASIGEMQAHHHKYRSKTTGRVTKAGSFTRDIGRWKFVDKMHVNKSTMNKYILHVAKGVGELASGWVPATKQWEGAGKLPKWIKRHGTGNGYVNDRMKDNGDGYIEIINEVPYASRFEGINNFVVKSQGRMLKNRIRGELRKIAREQEMRSK